ncbi:hypothetical protein [Sulfurimonas sp.]|uniref:hypothetical protein n=1 Tax=Sulfurimonas sp. TaxID=2022749 RepID=UPI0019F67C98|nr:hypothetical protein [Sulfurimonas sp.]MBE0514904.1 hypothetical protein [Sulfurimonas sp.]
MNKINISFIFVILLSIYFTLSSFNSLIPSIGLYYYSIILIVFFMQLIILKKVLDIKILMLIFGVFSFQLLYIMLGIVLSGENIDIAINNSKYLLIFILLPTFVYIIKENKLELLLKYLSLSMLIKIFVIFFIAIDLSFGNKVLEGYILNNTDLLVHPYFGVYRVFDSFVIFFPLAFYIINKFNITFKIIFHFIVFCYVLFSFATGMYLMYLLISLIVIPRKYIYLIFFLGITSYLLFQNYMDFEILNRLYESKMSDSVGVKANQVYWIMENISFFGQGLGYIFNINGRIDTMLENLHIYWLATYGIIGITIFYSVTLIMPIYISVKFKNLLVIKIISMVYFSALLSSIVNPYALSGVVFMFLILLIAYLMNYNKNYIKGTVQCSFL